MFRSICAKQYFTTGSCICKLLPQVFCGIWTWPNSISFSIRIKVMSIIEASKSLIRIFCRLWCATDDRKYLWVRMFHTIHRYAKANNKYMKQRMIRCCVLGANILYGIKCHKKYMWMDLNEKMIRWALIKKFKKKW